MRKHATTTFASRPALKRRATEPALAVLDTLTAGERIAQAAHAVTEMALTHPAAFRAWYQGTNTVVVVVMGALALERALGAATMEGDAAVAFHEPDRGGERTAVAIFPEGPRVRKLLRAAPLAGAGQSSSTSIVAGVACPFTPRCISLDAS